MRSTRAQSASAESAASVRFVRQQLRNQVVRVQRRHNVGVGFGRGPVNGANSGGGSLLGRPSLRHPGPASQAVMTRRAWWLLGLTWLIPGSAQVLAGARRLGRLGLAATLVSWAVLAAGLVVLLVAPSALYRVATLDATLLVAQGLLLVNGALWLLLTLDTLRLTRLVKIEPGSRAALSAVTVVILLASVGSAGYGSHLVGVSRGLMSSVFGARAPAAPVDGRFTILLLGGDAGEDREGLRPDSISVASIDARSGATTIIGLPRDLRSVPFRQESPMHDLYPDGYLWGECDVDPCMLNSIYTEVELKNPELYPDADAQGSSPGIQATRDAAEGILGMPIQYYVLIDMHGFANLIDALGGIDIDYTGQENLPFGGEKVDGELVGVNAWLTPGEHHLDGSNALAYARSRYGTAGGDYDRMARQREVQAAILARFAPVNVLLKFSAIAKASSEVIRTDIPQAMLGDLTQLALKARSQPVHSLNLTPPEVDPEDPDYNAIRADVHSVLDASASPQPPTSPSGPE